MSERFEERNKKFLSNNFEFHKTSVIELRQKIRTKLFMQKRVFQSDRFDDSLFDDLTAKYSQLQSTSLSISEKYKQILILFKDSPISEIDLLLSCLVNFCKSEPVSPAFLSVDISEKLVEILKFGDALLTSKALFVVINGTYLFDEFKFPLLKNGIVEVIIDYVIRRWEETENVVDCFWSLSHLVVNEKLYCLQIIAMGLGDFFIRKVNSSLTITISILEFGLSMLSTVFKTLKFSENPLSDPFLSITGKILSRSEPQILSHCFWILSSICQMKENIKKVLRPEILNRIFYALNNLEHYFLCPVFRLCGMIILGNREETEAIVGLGIVNNCFDVLMEKSQILNQEALWILLNIALDRENYKELIFDHPKFKILLEKVENELLDIKINALECLHAVIDMENYDKVLGKYKEILPHLVDSLKIQDARVLIHALEAISKIFKASVLKFLNNGQDDRQGLRSFFEELNGIDLIYKLNNHPNCQVYEEVRNFIFIHLNETESEKKLETEFKFS